MRVDIRVTGVRQAARRLDGLGDRAGDMRLAFHEIAGELMAGERRQFTSQSGWRPLAASTRERKRRQGKSLRVLHDSGSLERALTTRGAPGQLLDVKPDSVRFGIKGGRSDVYYGRFHEHGKGVPRRQIVVVTRRTARAFAPIIARHLGVRR